VVDDGAVLGADDEIVPHVGGFVDSRVVHLDGHAVDEYFAGQAGILHGGFELPGDVEFRAFSA